jgi:hypothetical protein
MMSFEVCGITELWSVLRHSICVYNGIPGSRSFLAVDLNYLECSEMWCWRMMRRSDGQIG